MVRKGSPVRVRQRALKEAPLRRGFLVLTAEQRPASKNERRTSSGPEPWARRPRAVQAPPRRGRGCGYVKSCMRTARGRSARRSALALLAIQALSHYDIAIAIPIPELAAFTLIAILAGAQRGHHPGRPRRTTQRARRPASNDPASAAAIAVRRGRLARFRRPSPKREKVQQTRPRASQRPAPTGRVAATASATPQRRVPRSPLPTPACRMWRSRQSRAADARMCMPGVRAQAPHRAVEVASLTACASNLASIRQIGRMPLTGSCSSLLRCASRSIAMPDRAAPDATARPCHGEDECLTVSGSSEHPSDDLSGATTGATSSLLAEYAPSEHGAATTREP